MVLLSSRFVVPLLCIGQLVAVVKGPSSPDKTWEWAVQAIWEIFVIMLSVSTAIIPQTRRFWAAIPSGGAHVEDKGGIELRSGGRYPPYGSGRSKDGPSRSHPVARSSVATAQRKRTDSDDSLLDKWATSNRQQADIQRGDATWNNQNSFNVIHCTVDITVQSSISQQSSGQPQL